jgi:acyl-coenzyme A thioesterase PaaI-like protein
MEEKTHLKINHDLCGKLIEQNEDSCKVELIASKDMITDDKNLIHGGFIFGLADYAAMLAVNEPNVVLASADVKFMLPVKVGEKLIAEASINTKKDSKFSVEVQVWSNSKEVFYGNFTCIVPEKHVLD